MSLRTVAEVLLVLVVTYHPCHCVQPTVHLATATSYTYQYSSTTELNTYSNIKVTAQFDIVKFDEHDGIQECLVTFKDIHMHVMFQGKQYDPTEGKDVTKWFSLTLTPSGEIDSVSYPPDEDPHVVVQKKMILSGLSNKLLLSQEKLKNLEPWAYSVNETGNDGEHEVRYEVTPDKKDIVFEKRRLSPLHQAPQANHGHTKEITLHRTLQVPQEVHIMEHVAAFSGTTEFGGSPDQGIDLPRVKASSSSTLKLLNTEASVKHLYAVKNRPDHLVVSALHTHELPPIYLPLDELRDDIRRSISCAWEKREAKQHGWSECFRELQDHLEALNLDDLIQLTNEYLEWRAFPHFAGVLVDGLGTAQTENTLKVMVEKVLRVEEPRADLVMRALAQLVALKEQPSQDILTVLEDIAMEGSCKIEDEDEKAQVLNRATLVLGILVRKVNKAEDRHAKWSNKIIKLFHDKLGVHDPFHHRKAREVLPHRDLQKLMKEKSTYLLTLGNARHPYSYDYIVSRINDTEAHVLLRTSAVEAVASYDDQGTADLLMHLALGDGEENVRRLALERYRTHPHGADLEAVLDDKHERHANVTSLDKHRVRRGLRDKSSKWGGFSFSIKTPSVNWVKTVGGRDLSASFGVIISNEIDINIGPGSGRSLIDIHDEAWAKLDVSLIGYELDFFRARLCFKNSVGYDVNILAEYGFESIKELAALFNKVVKEVVDLIDNGITAFRAAITAFKEWDVKEIIERLVQSVKDLPKNVLDIPRVAQRLREARAEYVDLPPVVEMMDDLIEKINKLYVDIRTDVMDLYEELVDIITVSIPFAVDEIKMGFEAVVEGAKNIVKDPKTSITNIGSGLARITIGVGMLEECKERLADANIFMKEERPYWFDMGPVIEDIHQDMQDIKEAIQDAIDAIQHNNDTDEAKKFTGVDLGTMKEIALDELRTIFEEEVRKSLEIIEELLTPFQLTFDLFHGASTNIKDAWETLSNSYYEARTLLEMIFGPKIHKEFPTAYFQSEECCTDIGFYPSNGCSNYVHPGVDAVIDVGDPVVAPFSGHYRAISDDELRIKVSFMKDVEVILNNVDPDPDLDDTLVEAGRVVGTVRAPPICEEGHVHLSMRKITSEGYINPERYMERRPMPEPKWEGRCDDYLLKFLGMTISSGSFLGDPEISDETPDLPDAPDYLMKTITQDPQEKRSLSQYVGAAQSILDTLNLPDFSKLSELSKIFDFKMSDQTIRDVFLALEYQGESELAAKLIDLLQTTVALRDNEMWLSPLLLDDVELRTALLRRGKSTHGSRETLEKRYNEPNPVCENLHQYLPTNTYCQFDDDCLGIMCAIELDLFIQRITKTAYIRLDPCTMVYEIGIGDYVVTIPISHNDFAVEDTKPLLENGLLESVQTFLHYRIEKVKLSLKVYVGLGWCSTLVEECYPLKHIINNAEFSIENCDDSRTSLMSSTPLTSERDLGGILDMKVKDVIKQVQLFRTREKVLQLVLDRLREHYKQALTKKKKVPTATLR